MSKTYIQELLSTYDLKLNPSVTWTDDETVTWLHGINPSAWIDQARVDSVQENSGIIYVPWNLFITFVKDGEMNGLLNELTEQQLSETWQMFRELRALHISYYTPQGVLATAISADCADPWGEGDYRNPMPKPSINNVAFKGHGELGWPDTFLRALWEFGRPKDMQQ